MTWPSQVRHVFVRDLRESWQSLAIVAVSIAVPMVLSVRAVSLSLGADMTIETLKTVVILHHLAQSVTTDPPQGSGSFWRTQPLDGSAVAVAKLLHVGLLLLVLAIALRISHVAWNIAGDNSNSIIATTMMTTVGRLLPVLLAASLYGAVPRAAFSVTMLCYVYGRFVQDLPDSFFRWPGKAGMLEAVYQAPDWIRYAVLLGAASVLIWRYRLTEVSRRQKAIVVLATVAPFGVLISRPSALGAPTANTSEAPRIEMSGGADHGYARMVLRAPNGLPFDRHRLVDVTVTAELRNGSRITLSPYDSDLNRRDQREAPIRLADGASTVFGDFLMDLRTSSEYHVVASLRDSRDEKRFRDSVVRYILDGTLLSYALEEIDRVPVRGGQVARRDGRSIMVTFAPSDSTGLLVGLTTKWLTRDERQRSAWPDQPASAFDLAFALVNRDSRAMLPLRRDVNDGSNRSGSSMGLSVAEVGYTLTPYAWAAGRPHVDPAWLARSELVVGAPVLMSAVRIHVEGAPRADAAMGVTRPEP